MGGSSGGGMGSGGMGGLITSGVSSIANVGAGWFADKQLAKGTAESMQRQNEANALYRDLYGQTQADYAPYQEGGKSAYADLLASYGVGSGGQQDLSKFYQSPDYQFALTQGQNALDRSAAARGRLYSGAQMQGSQQFGQGLATQYLGNYRSGLGNIAGMGMNANSALANYRGGYGNQLGQGITNLGDLAMARRLGRANINYRNVAAQDSIWGGQFGASGVAQNGANNGGGNYGGGQNAMNWGGGGQSSYGSPTTETWSSGGRKYGGSYG